MAEEPSQVRAEQSVGSALREARESRGVSLEEAAGVTRIGRNYLSALEGDSFDKLPNPAYVKGFIRVYAGYLGLSGDDLVARYEATISPAPKPAQEQTKKPGPRRDRKSGPQPLQRWAIPLFLLALVLASAYLTRERGGEPPTVTPPPQPIKAPPVAPSVQKPVSSAAARPVQPAAQPDGKEAPGGEGSLPPAKGVILRLKVNQDCWLNITIDGSLSQQYDLRAGDLIEWKGETSFSLDLGNAGGVEAEFNGKSLPPLGEAGKPAHIVLKATGTGE